MPAIDRHRNVQAAAKTVLARLAETIAAADTERTIASRATSMLASLGIAETWYHDCPAFVLLGSRSCLSISGRDYRPAEEPVGATNLVTVDLSPDAGGVWGDCARSFFVEEGKCVDPPTSPEFVQGAEAQRLLHADVMRVATPDTTFEQLFEFANERIRALGFENLDFVGNVGHSIESSPSERLFIESANARPLGSVAMFTFEPHIGMPGGRWGFKHENIYYFHDGRLQEL